MIELTKSSIRCKQRYSYNGKLRWVRILHKRQKSPLYSQDQRFNAQITISVETAVDSPAENQLFQFSPVADGSNLAMSGNNRFFAFLSTLDHVVQESIECNDYPRLAFS